MGHDARSNPHSLEHSVTYAPIVFDERGVPLGAGSIVLIVKPLLARVASVIPLLDPKAPKNFVKVRIESVSELAVPAGSPLTDVFAVPMPRPAEGQKPAANGDGQDAGQPSEDPGKKTIKLVE